MLIKKINICQVHLGALNKTLEVNSLPLLTMMEIIKIAVEFVVCCDIVCSALNAKITKDDIPFTRTICKSSLGEENISDILGVVAIEFLSRTSSKELSTKAAIALNHAQLLPSATFRAKQVILNRAKIQVHLARLPKN